MLKIFFIALIGGAISMAGIKPSVAGSKSFLGGAIAGGVGVMLLHSMSRNNNRNNARPVRRNTRVRPAPRRRIERRRVVRRRHPSAALEPRMSRDTKRDIQTALNDREFNVGRPDGAFGGNTRRGIKQFQGSISAPVTGYLTQRQVTLLLEPATEPQNPIAGRLPVSPSQGYNSAPPTYNNAQTFQSLETSPQPTLAVASRGYANTSSKGYLEDAPQ